MAESAMAVARRLAREQKLKGVSFFDKDGNMGARGDAVVRIELEFSNGEKVSLTKQEMAMLKGVKFDLQMAPAEPI